jgi:deoxyribodipyrimidine photo-lyase
VYNPRKQVRDHDPDGEWITEWVPELAPLPSEYLDRPERAPLAVQAEHGVTIGEDYPRPVVAFETRRESFWTRYERHRPEAARALARPEIAKRASFSGGYAAARAIANDAEPEGADAVQQFLADVGGRKSVDTGSAGPPAEESEAAPETGPADDVTRPTGAGKRAGEPSPDDRAAVPDREDDTGNRGETAESEGEQTRLPEFD